MVSVCPWESFHTIQDVAHTKSETTALGSLSAMERFTVAPWFFSKGTYGKVGKGSLNYPFFFLGGGISPFLIGNALFRLVSYNNSCWEFCASSKAQLGESGVANFFLVSGEMKSETSMWTLKIHGGKQPPRLHNAKGSYDVSFCVYIYIFVTSTLMFIFMIHISTIPFP